jgi:hypothetical protein
MSPSISRNKSPLHLGHLFAFHITIACHSILNIETGQPHYRWL